MPKRILLVDDEPDIVKIVIFRLKKAGYEIEYAANGKEALEVLKNKPRFDMILLDLVMPVMDGAELARILHQNNIYKDIPIIIFSASAGRNMDQRAKDLHACDYILKPFEPETLFSKVKMHIDKK